MLNYANLNDTEFEALCKDIMERMLGVSLRRFGPGRDGGVDLTDDVSTKEIVVQVKHYRNSTTDQLVRSLKSELSKVRELKPQKYYICCSRELSAANINELYQHFQAYMISDRHIVTLIEIDDFLKQDINRDIRKKYTKLWMDDAGILEELHTEIGELRDTIQKRSIDCKPQKYVLPSNLSSPDYFVPNSRDEELSLLEKDVHAGKTVFLHGMGGIGKTECAIALAERLAPPRGAYLIHFQDSMKNTVMQMDFSGYKYEPNQPGMSPEALTDAEYCERLDILREYYQDAVLIIDNFDSDQQTLDDLRREPAFNDFLGLKLKRIFTTRYPVGKKEWEIRELSENYLLDMMRFHCKDSNITDNQYLAILKEIRGHTLTAMLIAKTIQESWGDVTPEMILEALRSSTLSQESYPDVVSDQDRIYRQSRIYEHLKTLFDLSGMSQNHKTVLTCASLLPDSGMDARLFKSCLRQEEQTSLIALEKRGWLNRTRQNQLIIHPLIREVCRQELSSTDSTCDSFAEKLWGYYDRKHYDHSKYLSIADWTSNAAAHLPDEHAWFAQNALLIYLDICQYDKAILHGKIALQKLSYNLQLNAERIALINLHIASAHFCSGNYTPALQHANRGLDIMDEYMVDNEALRASIFNTIGLIMGALGEYKEQVEWCRLALAAHQCSKDNDPRNISAYYVNLALALEELGDLQNAYASAMTAVQKQQECDNPDHPELAKALHALGHIMYTLAQKTGMHQLYELAIDRYRHAETVRRKYLPDDHPSFAPLYRDIAKAYHKLEDWSQAITYYQLAVENNDVFSMNELSMLLINGMGCTPDIPRGLALLEIAANLGGVDAACNLGLSYLYGINIPVDYQKAEYYLTLAADHPYHPHAEACGQLYALYQGLISGAKTVISTDPERALVYLEKANTLGLERITLFTSSHDE